MCMYCRQCTDHFALFVILSDNFVYSGKVSFYLNIRTCSDQNINSNYLHLFYIYFYICSTFVLFVSLFVSFVLHPLSDSLLFIIISSSINSWYLYSHLISFVWSQGQRLTLFFLSSSFVFISHLTNFLSYSVFMSVACLFLCHLRKNLLGSKRKAINIYFAVTIMNSFVRVWREWNFACRAQLVIFSLPFHYDNKTMIKWWQVVNRKSW